MLDQRNNVHINDIIWLALCTLNKAMFNRIKCR